ncbi:hypothetical protein F5B18DRAFT_104106 [Nemania serpens]|nr:hypothetical protein F5B18DRAFT_104106 [Nemania serpens]
MEGLANNLTTYKQYKEDTESIAGWLAQNAARCGYRVADMSPSTGRLKGKTRKQARDAAKSGSAQAAKEKHPYTINVSDFTLMADAIASFKPAVKIPTALGNLFSRAIETRRLFGDWYGQHAHDEHQSNQRHSHFANVLSNTWEILRPFEQARKAGTSKASGKASGHRSQPGQRQPGLSDEPSVHLANRFSALHVETSSEQDTAAESAAQPDKSDCALENVVPVAIIKSEEDIEDDFLLAIYSFFHDLQALRECLRLGYWPTYCLEIGNELILTTLITNTAIQLVRRAEQQLDLLIERPKKYPFPTHNFPAIMMHATHKGFSNKSIKEFVKPSDSCYLVACELADLVFWDIYQALQNALRYIERFGGDSLHVAGPDDNPDAPESFRRVRHLLPCFRTVATTRSSSFASDEVTSAIGHIFETKTIPIWTLFALQVLLDAQDAMHSVEDSALQTVKWHTRRVSNAFESLDLKAKDYAINPVGIQWMGDVIRAYEKDVLEDHFRKDGIVSRLRAIDYKGKKLPIKSLDDIPPDYDIPPEDSDNPSVLMQSLLGRLSFVVGAEMGSLLFDCMSFAKTCRALWDRILASADAFYGKGGSIYGVLLVMLDEAGQLQWQAEDLNSPDVASFVRDNAVGLPRSWAIIQKMNKTVVEQPKSPSGSGFSAKTTWVGDQEINGVIVSPEIPPPYYPPFRKLKHRLYKGWRDEDIKESLFMYTDSEREFMWKRQDEEFARARAEAEVAAAEPLPNGKWGETIVLL